ncbi:MAG: hypothetical protein ACPL7B_01190 [Candidatus Poribacteria bacterium]
MKKNVTFTLTVIFLVLVLALSGCGNKAKAQKLTFKGLLDTYLLKEVSISMWNAEKSKPEISTYTVAEVNDDYLIVKITNEKGEKRIAIPFINITSVILTDTPPTIVLNDQILLSGFGETIDNVGYVGSRIERLGRTTKTNEQ